jgi:hypothetical protein
MRGAFVDQGGLFSYISPEARVPPNHPQRKIRVRDVLGELNSSFAGSIQVKGAPRSRRSNYSARCSAGALRHSLGAPIDGAVELQSIVSLVRGLSPDDPVWNPTTFFTKNRERLQNGDVFTNFMTRLLKHPQVEPLLSDEPFSVDGTLVESWASQKSFRAKNGGDGDDGTNFHGQTRKNDSHISTSDPDSRLYRKAAGREARLCYMKHVTMENRHGLAVASIVTHASGTAERRAAEIMLEAEGRKAGRCITVGADKAYDTADHVANLRAIDVTPHVTQNNGMNKTGRRRRSASTQGPRAIRAMACRRRAGR